MTADNLPPVPEALEKWRSEGTVKDIDGHKIFVHTSGPKSDHGVLIVHGYPGSSWDWSGVIASLAERTRVVAADMLGYGQSDKPADGNYSIFKSADMFEASRRRKGFGTLSLSSMTWARRWGRN